MKCACAVFMLVVGAILFAPTKQADAGPISRNNPYRSFNISGVNYGSMQWENKHRKSIVEQVVVERPARCGRFSLAIKEGA